MAALQGCKQWKQKKNEYKVLFNQKRNLTIRHNDLAVI